MWYLFYHMPLNSELNAVKMQLNAVKCSQKNYRPAAGQIVFRENFANLVKLLGAFTDQNGAHVDALLLVIGSFNNS